MVVKATFSEYISEMQQEIKRKNVEIAELKDHGTSLEIVGRNLELEHQIAELKKERDEIKIEKRNWDDIESDLQKMAKTNLELKDKNTELLNVASENIVKINEQKDQIKELTQKLREVLGSAELINNLYIKIDFRDWTKIFDKDTEYKIVNIQKGEDEYIPEEDISGDDSGGKDIYIPKDREDREEE